MNDLNKELDKIIINVEDELLINKKSIEKVKKEVAKTSLSVLTGGISDVFFNMISIKGEINEDIRNWKIEQLFNEYIKRNEGQKEQIRKLEQLSAPYGYMLVRESIKIIDDKPFDTLETENIAEIIDRVCSDNIENDDNKYYDYINLLHYTRILSPYALKIIKDIQTPNGLLNSVKYKTKSGDYRGREDIVNSLFLKNYQSEHNFNGYRFGFSELINGGHLQIYSNGENLYVSIPTTTKMLNLYLTGNL